MGGLHGFFKHLRINALEAFQDALAQLRFDDGHEVVQQVDRCFLALDQRGGQLGVGLRTLGHFLIGLTRQTGAFVADQARDRAVVAAAHDGCRNTFRNGFTDRHLVQMILTQFLGERNEVVFIQGVRFLQDGCSDLDGVPGQLHDEISRC